MLNCNVAVSMDSLCCTGVCSGKVEHQRTCIKTTSRREDESHHACAEVDSQLGLVAQLPAKTFGKGHLNLPPCSTAVWWTSGRQQTQSTNRPPARTRDPDGSVPPSPRRRAVATSLRAHVCFEPAPLSKPPCCQVGQQQTTRHAKCVCVCVCF